MQDMLSIVANIGGLGVDGGTGAEGVPIGVGGNVADDGEDESCRGGDVRGPVHGNDGGGAGDDYCGEAIGGRPGWRGSIAHLGWCIVEDLGKKALQVGSTQSLKKYMPDRRSTREESSGLKPVNDDFASTSGFSS